MPASIFKSGFAMRRVEESMTKTTELKNSAGRLGVAPHRLVAGLAMAVIFGAQAHAQSTPGWKNVGQVGAARIVTLDQKSKTKLEERVWAALRSNCPSTFCNVHFYWEHQYPSIRGLPQRELAKHAVLIYSNNDGFKWNCTYRPFADNCFTRK